MAGLQQAVEDGLQGFPILVGLAIGQHDAGDLVALQRPGQPLQIQRRHGLVADDRHLAADDVPGQQRAVVEQPGTDVNGITARAEIDLKSLHGTPILDRPLG
ncbi:hypothetical protein D3C77_590390 [compost metagenome]